MSENAEAAQNIEGPGKGRAFFERARTVAASSNYDYAIDMYIEGLNREPFNVGEHKQLRDTAMRRKLAGGKPAGGLLGPKVPYKGKTPKEAMLNAEWLLAKDVGNIPAMQTVVRNAAALDLRELVVWAGSLLRDANKTSKSPKAEIFIELADLLEKVGEYNEASLAIQEAIKLKPTDGELQSRAKDLSAKETLEKGKYEKGGDFKDSIKDREQTKQLLEEENLGKSDEYRIKALETAKEEYDKNPIEVQVISKYSKALRAMDDEEHENQAMEMLKKAYKETQIYRFKAEMGDIRIHQYRRNMRLLREAVKADPEDKGTLQQLQQLAKERLNFEMAEYKERVENMPTDLGVKYEYGVRLWEAHKFDEAIVALQEAQNNPKHRVEALHLLGRAFLTQGMKPEAVETLKKAIDEYDLAQTGDKKAKELFYWYGVALEENGEKTPAIDVYSKIVRWDIGFKDARKRMTDLRAQVGG